MPRRTVIPVPEAKLAFLAGLRRGALVVEAARETGVALWTFYRWRRSDAEFDSAWTAAAEGSLGWTFERRPGKPARVVRTGRRVRFGGARREAFLAALATSCHTGDSAREAGVNVATIYRHLRRDPGFALDNEAAMEAGYRHCLVRLEEEQEEARRRPPVIHTTGRPTADFDEGMRILARWTRPLRPRGRRGEAPRRRPPSFDEQVEILERRLRRAFPWVSGPR